MIIAQVYIIRQKRPILLQKETYDMSQNLSRRGRQVDEHDVTYHMSKQTYHMSKETYHVSKETYDVSKVVSVLHVKRDLLNSLNY